MTIVWHKWRDPLERLKKKAESDRRVYDRERERAARDSFGDFAYGSSRTEDDYGDDGEFSGPAIIGTEGPVPLHEECLPGRLYNFWVGHTDFDLTVAMAKAISEVAGVESLDVFSRYRFRISVGKVWRPDLVKTAVEDACHARFLSADRLATICSAMKSRYPFWAVCVRGNKRVECVGGETADEVDERASACRDAVRTYRSWK